MWIKSWVAHRLYSKRKKIFDQTLLQIYKNNIYNQPVTSSFADPRWLQIKCALSTTCAQFGQSVSDAHEHHLTSQRSRNKSTSLTSTSSSSGATPASYPFPKCHKQSFNKRDFLRLRVNKPSSPWTLRAQCSIIRLQMQKKSYSVFQTWIRRKRSRVNEWELRARSSAAAFSCVWGPEPRPAAGVHCEGEAAANQSRELLHPSLPHRFNLPLFSRFQFHFSLSLHHFFSHTVTFIFSSHPSSYTFQY